MRKLVSCCGLSDMPEKRHCVNINEMAKGNKIINSHNKAILPPELYAWTLYTSSNMWFFLGIDTLLIVKFLPIETDGIY